ncbi:hypothetical protein [Ferruginibacter sp. SUN106]|uniref:hypothetical protein n=1 Tax=Ferruginibacter sp. SUN106 TaxID=2978348 RepID=UPI003D35F592
MKLIKTIFQIFKKPQPPPLPDILFPGLVSSKQFAALKPGQRMQAVMIVGDTGDVKFYKFMQWCILRDPDPGVQFAALKRLHHFSGQADLVSFLQQLDTSANKSNLEPYLSMALHRLGVITNDELKSRLNGV